MSRFHPRHEIDQILAAAQYWKEVALLGCGSVLSSSQLWTDQNLGELKHYYVDNLDYGEGNFLSKLQLQLADASPHAIQLAAELMWVMLLCPSNIGAQNKRETIKTIWRWSDTEFPAGSAYLHDNVLCGIGSAGTAFNTQRWRELRYFIWFLQAFRQLPRGDQENLLTSDGWAMAEWMEQVPETDSRQLRHMILYLLFPDQFERIFGRSDKTSLLQSFTSIPRGQINRLSALEMSREVQRIRKEQERIYGTEDIDFYDGELSKKWKAQKTSEAPSQQEASAFESATKGISREHVLEAIREIAQEGVPQSAHSTTYDLIHGSKRYPPKLVLSLAAKHATGTIFQRDAFSGGENSQAFKFLRDRGFAIERKDFNTELLKKFIEQANGGADLTTREYPKRYRELDLKVSFGQGVFARVPWISYTGYGQTTSHGIYPVILYFKSIGVLIVAYGLSETKSPDIQWKSTGQGVTVKQYLDRNHNHQPERYGASYVHTGFDINEDVNFEDIEAALDNLIGLYHTQFESESTPIATSVESESSIEPYTADDALADLFIEEEKFAEILELARAKKNLILQGPPGVGKTYACKRLAYTLLGEKDGERVGMVQFHQSYSYEDFVQGYRPSAQGLRLRNGIFYDFCDLARDDPSRSYVFIIDELNRANLSKVFGELMLLMESDKRGKEWAIQLAYSEEDSPKFYIPENLFLVGLMNTADRSLAMVDYGLRRRFAFATLTPGFETDQFFTYMQDRGADQELISEIVERMGIVNRHIAEDTANLGPGFCIGHSFFCSIPDGLTPDWNWYKRIIKSEIEPLLREYYFDATKQADALVEKLLQNR